MYLWRRGAKKQAQATSISISQLRTRRAMTIFCCCAIICAPTLKKLKRTPQQNMQSCAIRTATAASINCVRVNTLLDYLGGRGAGNIIIINKKAPPRNQERFCNVDKRIIAILLRLPPQLLWPIFAAVRQLFQTSRRLFQALRLRSLMRPASSA